MADFRQIGAVDLIFMQDAGWWTWWRMLPGWSQRGILAFGIIEGFRTLECTREEKRKDCGKMADKIGNFLVQIGAMKEYQVEDVLRVQKAGDGRMFGEIAIELGYINDDAIRRYLDYLEKHRENEDDTDRPSD